MQSITRKALQWLFIGLFIITLLQAIRVLPLFLNYANCWCAYVKQSNILVLQMFGLCGLYIAQKALKNK